MKLSAKITLLVTILFIGFGISFILISNNILHDRLITSQDEWVETLVHAVSEDIALKTINGDVLSTRERLKVIVERDVALDYAYVTDFDGNIFAHTFDGGFPRALIHQAHTTSTEHNTLQPIPTSHGDILDIAHPLIEGMIAHMHLGVNMDEINAVIQDANRDVMLLVLLLALIGSGTAVLITRRITTPIYRLADVVRAYGEGELSEITGIDKSSHEVEVLTKSFGKMIEDRRLLETNLNERDILYRRLVESSTAIPWELDLATWRFTYIGNQIVKLLGYPVEDWYTENFWMDHVHPDDRDRATSYCQSKTADGENHEFEYRMISSDNRTIWIRDDVSIIYHNDHPVRLQGFMFDVTSQKDAELEQQQHNELMQQKQYAFLNWAKSKNLDLQQAFHQATELSAETLQTDRVSIWLYNPEHTAIVCKDLYISHDNKHDEGMQLEASNFPNYFTALEANRTLAISDARHEPETKEFTDSYLVPLDIHSMLDVPIRREGQVVGVVCHEHTGSVCEWSLEQQDFAASIASTVALAIEANERRLAELKLQANLDHLEEIVKERTNELQVLNHELESFGYSVSHDLRAPLRAIDGFSQMLLEDYADAIDDQGKDYLQRIRNSSQRMGELIVDLLKLSRISRATLNYEAVDLGAIAESILSDLDATYAESRVQYHVHETEKVMCDPSLIRVVLENLLSNAWKYSSKIESPVIEFGMEKDGVETKYYVKDNGVGFDMKFADKLFGAFQRLHGKEFDGTGIGLATVKRVINRHGGRIWAKAQMDHGATFYFTLGKKTELAFASSSGQD